MGCSSSCGVQTTVNGTLSDGSGSSPYANDANCAWVIAPGGAGQITITFTEFNTQSGKDIVRILQCTSTSCAQQQQLAELSGTYSSAQVFTSTTGFVKVVFMSDSSVNAEGFTASWNLVRTHVCLFCFSARTHTHTNASYASCCQQEKYLCKGCGSACGLQTAWNGTLTDGSGTSDYSNNANCVWMIAPNSDQITIRFTDFSTQNTTDILRVYQCPDLSCQTSQQLVALSGAYSNRHAVTSTTGFMKLVFESDSSITYSGFTASWSSVRFPNHFLQTMHAHILHCELIAENCLFFPAVEGEVL